MNWRNTLLLFVPGTIWGITFILAEYSLETIPPLTITASRSFLTVLLFGAVLYLRGGSLPPLGPAWIPYIILGLFNDGLPYILTTWAQVHIDAGLASILISVNPFFVVFLAHFFIADEHLTRDNIIGMVLGLLGVIILIGPQALQSVGSNMLAQLAVVGAALCYAIGAVYMRNLLRQAGNSHLVDRLPQTLTGQMICTTLIIVPLSLFEQPWTVQPSGTSIIALLAMVFLGSGVALAVYYYLLDQMGATFVSVVVYLIPINGVLWSALLLGEPITVNTVIALLVILLGVAIVNGVFRRRSATAVAAGR